MRAGPPGSAVLCPSPTDFQARPLSPQVQQLKAEKAALQLAEMEKDKTIAALEGELARCALDPPAWTAVAHAFIQ